MNGEPYHDVEPGFFGIGRERLRTWTPPFGFSKSLLDSPAKRHGLSPGKDIA
jgi:hypothetical protein